MTVELANTAAECHKRIAEKYGVSDLQADECYADSARVALAEVAAIDSQVV
jgi:hypothetical protein